MEFFTWKIFLAKKGWVCLITSFFPKVTCFPPHGINFHCTSCFTLNFSFPTQFKKHLQPIFLFPMDLNFHLNQFHRIIFLFPLVFELHGKEEKEGKPSLPQKLTPHKNYAISAIPIKKKSNQTHINNFSKFSPQFYKIEYERTKSQNSN